MITIRNLVKRYGSVTALQIPECEFPTGKVTALIGPSGCGKSTLLRLLLRLIEPDGADIAIDGSGSTWKGTLEPGTVTIDGEAVTAESAQGVRRKVGYVIQDGGLFPHLTARENVTLMGRHLDRPVDIAKLADLVRLPQDALDRYPLELSGGQRQRVGLMRALALDPSTLLLDEPLGALDPLVRSSLQTDLKEIFSRLGKTVVFVTHDMGEAAYLADQIVLLRDGRIVQVGTLEEFQHRPADPFVTEFLNAQRALVAL